VGDLVGEHPVLAELEERVIGELAEFLHLGEHVDRKALERSVHAGKAEHRIVRACSFEQHGVLLELPDLGAHPVGQLGADLDVARFVPRLAGHVELQLERDRALRPVACVEVVGGATGTLECLDLADHDAVHQ